jgi:hypothetical protein
MTPDAWKGTSPYAGHPKWDINFILVGNTAGFGTLTDMNEQELCKDVAAFLCSATADRKNHARLRNQPRLALNYRSPRPSGNCYLWAEPDDSDELPRVRCFENALAEVTRFAGHALTEGAHADVQTLYSNRSPLLVDPEQLIYTDGSVMSAKPKETIGDDGNTARSTPCAGGGLHDMPTSRQVVGAGLFIPNKTPDQLRAADGAADTTPQACGVTLQGDEHAHGTLLYIDPSGDGPTNTITRAESAAILHALKWRNLHSYG